MNAQLNIPEGYWLDPKGNLVPDANVKEIDKLRDQTVRTIFEKVYEIHDLLKNFKDSSFSDIANFSQISADQYGAKIGGNKGNLSLSSYDGRLKIQRNIAEKISFNEQLQAAKQLIDECLEEWTDGSRNEIKALINRTFNVDKKGEISTSKVLALKTIDIKHPKWQQAMQAISDSINIIGSKAYLRFYTRNDETGVYLPISLDIASI